MGVTVLTVNYVVKSFEFYQYIVSEIKFVIDNEILFVFSWFSALIAGNFFCGNRALSI